MPAKIVELRYAQDDWCPGVYCAYAVKVQGDRAPDGASFATPVREDDPRCIRPAPPPAPRSPPRLAVGTRVECNGGPQRGWKAGVIKEHWVEYDVGAYAPYMVELDAPGPNADRAQIVIFEDDERALRVEYNAFAETEGIEDWPDDAGAEAVYDLLIGGKLSSAKTLPKVGLCGEEAAVDALTDAVAAAGSKARRVALMVEQILAT